MTMLENSGVQGGIFFKVIINSVSALVARLEFNIITRKNL